MAPHPLLTPDHRYVVVDGRLWRAANPALSDESKDLLIHQLMDARRRVKAALSAHDAMALASARQAANTAKTSLGERGPVWWSDGAPDFNRHVVKNTPYAGWYEMLHLARP